MLRLDEPTRLWLRALYRETDELWRIHSAGNPFLRAGKFSLFYSVPRPLCPVMIIGENPGGDPLKDSFTSPLENGTLERLLDGTLPHDYLRVQDGPDDYGTAKLMRRIFACLQRPDLLAASVKLNLNFFRSNTRDVWQHQVPREVARELERFCAAKLEEIVRTLRPKVILTEGWRAFDAVSALLGKPEKEIAREVNARGHRLAVANVHPAGVLVGLRHVASRPRLSTEPASPVAAQMARVVAEALSAAGVK